MVFLGGLAARVFGCREGEQREPTKNSGVPVVHSLPEFMDFKPFLAWTTLVANKKWDLFGQSTRQVTLRRTHLGFVI